MISLFTYNTEMNSRIKSGMSRFGTALYTSSNPESEWYTYRNRSIVGLIEDHTQRDNELAELCFMIHFMFFHGFEFKWELSRKAQDYLIGIKLKFGYESNICARNR